MVNCIARPRFQNSRPIKYASEIWTSGQNFLRPMFLYPYKWNGEWRTGDGAELDVIKTK